MDQQVQQNSPLQPDNNQAPPGPNVKQQIVEYINGAKNVLVTVSASPSIDDLAAALGLTFMLGKLDKHATAVFSGQIPPAMEFLDPKKIFENNVDSLRDFIIALDKEKADKLRYKVEDDVVKIFITPYKTTLTKDDFDFSQGDFNVDVVVALGVQKRDDLDRAITAHGRILHDATVVTINTTTASSLGVVDWTDPSASSIAEMLLSISESFGSGLLDEQISTAYLTGIVAATNRFSNDKTSPKVMTMAAQLMATGANQQLIATNLRREGMITEDVRGKKDSQSQDNDDGELSLRHGKKKSSKPDKTNNNNKQNDGNKKTPSQPNRDSDTDGTEQPSQSDSKPTQKKESEQDKPQDDNKSSPNLGDDLAKSPVEADNVASTTSQQQPAAPVMPTPTPQPINTGPPMISPSQHREETDKPVFGGTLNATTADAEETKRAQAQQESQANNISLAHDQGPDQAAQDAIEAARREIEDATEAAPFDPANNPTQAIGSTPIPSQAPTPAVHPVDSAVMDRQIGSAPATGSATAESEPSPIESFMQPHAEGVKPPEQQQVPPTVSPPQPDAFAPVPPVSTGGMPPMPPLPPLPTDGNMPPLPPLPPMPGQQQDGTANFQPQTTPDFLQTVNQSQNPWTEAGQDMAPKQADKDAARQAKLDEINTQYDAAVDKNREIQGKPPLNNDHSTFPLPPTQ